MKSLSQSGFHRIPHNPNQRVPMEGGTKPSGKVLDGFNENQEDRVLHPTNGFRSLSVRRSRAQALVSAIMNGRSADLSEMRRFLVHGY
jgi:hypothetical protein